MPISEDQLRELLVERSAQPPFVADRSGQIRARIARRRRQQGVLAIAASVVAVLVVVLAVTVPAQLRTSRTSTAAGATTLPEYYDGGKLIATMRLHTPEQGSASITFTPTNWQLTISAVCTSGRAWPADVGVEEAINGQGVTVSSCGSGIGGTGAGLGQEEKFWSAEGVRLGHPSTLTTTLTEVFNHPSPPDVPVPAAQHPTGVVAVGIYQRVPLDKYPFPKKPKTLPPIEPGPGASLLDSRKVGANGQWTLRITPTMSNLHWQANAVSPGSLRITVDG